MALCKLATAVIATAEAVGVEGDLDDLMSSEKTPWPRQGKDCPRISS